MSRDGQPADATRTTVKEGAGADRGKKRAWDSARAFKRRSMVAVQEVRWE